MINLYCLELIAARGRADWAAQLGPDGSRDARGLPVAAVRENLGEPASCSLTDTDAGSTPTGCSLPGFARVREVLSERSTDADLRDLLTPEEQHQRFSTRFFIAPLAEGQLARHDEVEVTSLRWAYPKWARGEQTAGRARIIFPTRRILRSLATCIDAATAVAAASKGDVDQ